MMVRLLVPILLHAILAAAHSLSYRSTPLQATLSGTTNGTGLTINNIPYSTREHWMREANQALFALSGSCPFAAFGSVIVDHSQSGLGELICIGANRNSKTGNPTLHGEIAAIGNCSEVLTDPNGKWNYTASEALSALSRFSLYTNAESCPM